MKYINLIFVAFLFVFVYVGVGWFLISVSPHQNFELKNSAENLWAKYAK